MIEYKDVLKVILSALIATSLTGFLFAIYTVVTEDKNGIWRK